MNATIKKIFQIDEVLANPMEALDIQDHELVRGIDTRLAVNQILAYLEFLSKVDLRSANWQICQHSSGVSFICIVPTVRQDQILFNWDELGLHASYCLWSTMLGVNAHWTAKCCALKRVLECDISHETKQLLVA